MRPEPDRALEALLALTVMAPALAFAWGSRDGHLVFVLYREPKLATFEVLGWALLAGFAWRSRPRPGLSLRQLVSQPVPALTALLVGYMALTALWVRVPANLFYELRQYGLLAALLFCLVSWGAAEHRLRRLVVLCLVVSFIPITLLGLLQLGLAIPLLPPIDPQYGVVNPSLMGYKNPMALALLGQLYLLLFLVCEPAGEAAAGRVLARRLGWGLLLALELVYLATLKSRTSYLALLLSGGLLVALLLRFRRAWPGGRRLALALVAAAMLFVGLLAAGSGTRARAASMLGYLTHPSAYLESDRGTYLRNTLVMVRHHPFGVGLGDWQTHYPVYRRHNRYTSFSDAFQARRAHGDHVQMLGELGWQGVAVWLALLFAAVGRPLRAFARHGDRLALFTGLQITVLGLAMTTDYLMEIPYNKLQMFLLLALAALAGPLPTPSPGRPGAGRLPAAAVTLLAVVGAVYAASCLLKSHSAAAVREVYVSQVEPTVSAPGSAAALAPALDLLASRGRRFNRLVGHDKTFFKDHLLLAHGALLKSETDGAVAHARRSLELHPYYPNAFRLLAVITRATDPALSRLYAETYRYLMHDATEGFQRPYPPLPAASTVTPSSS